ncbi:hypothetical protein EUX98_g7843 [Antrodiella citrinella]|uniref:Uncharacterized protein n=1 Tax=Antrodiella citrinella TaxID=2447956 RepID=A0A4S4ML31_9APHY|nr:hypothetical protein EUX98_g7843 [Antrodiella citrinella]
MIAPIEAAFSQQDAIRVYVANDGSEDAYDQAIKTALDRARDLQTLQSKIRDIETEKNAYDARDGHLQREVQYKGQIVGFLLNEGAKTSDLVNESKVRTEQLQTDLVRLKEKKQKLREELVALGGALSEIDDDDV